MAISIKNYIDISSKIVQGTVSNLDFSGLVFTTDSMKTTVDAEYSAIKTKYEGTDSVDPVPVALTLDAITACFDSDKPVYKFAQLYFGYNGGNHSPIILNVAKAKSSEGADDVYTRVIANFTNFGAFCFLGTLNETLADLKTVATNNESACRLFVVPLKASSSTLSTDIANFSNCKYTHITLATDDDDDLASWMAVAWYASVDYTKTDASATMDYKQFSGASVVCSTDAKKAEYDGLKANYIGLVQVNGQSLSFYQTGINMSGTDTGVIRDEVWLRNQIEAGWFNLSTSSSKVPANYTGAAMVKAMILDVAARGIDNGSILVEKELTDLQVSQILAFTDNDDAANQVQSTGYYIDTKIVQSGTQYVCQYTLVYAKGDHIGKVTGTNYLV